MTKLYHCRVNMLFVRRDGPFLPEELQTLSLMTQAVVDAVGKRHDGTFRCYVEVEPRIRQLASTSSDEGAVIRARQKPDETSTDAPKREGRRK